MAAVFPSFDPECRQDELLVGVEAVLAEVVFCFPDGRGPDNCVEVCTCFVGCDLQQQLSSAPGKHLQLVGVVGQQENQLCRLADRAIRSTEEKKKHCAEAHGL